MRSETHRPHATARHGRVSAGRLLAVLAVAAGLLPGGLPDAPRIQLASEHVAGSLDPDFDDDGIAITEISSYVDARDVAVQIQPDGSERLLVLEGIDDEVWRFHPDGTLDTSFDGDGVLPLALDFAPTALAASPADGSFVIGGFTGAGVQVARYLPDGGPDADFPTDEVDPDGVATVLSGSEEGAGACEGETLGRTLTGFRDIAFQSDGSIIVVGPATVEFDFGAAPCSPSPVPGLAVARLHADGAMDGVRGDAPCSGFTDFADPRSMTLADDDRVFVSVAFQCIAGPDPVTVFEFSADLNTHEGYAESDPHPTDGRRLPIVVRPDGTVGVAARGADGTEPSTWNLLRWSDDGAFVGTTTIELPAEATTAVVADMELGEGDSFVVLGTAAGADPLAIATFTAGGDPGSTTVVDHPQPTTGLVGVALARVDTPQPSLRVVGAAEPRIEGLGNHRQMMLARLELTGALDPSFGAGGFALHHGRYGELGRAVAVRSDGSIDAAGTIPVTGIAKDPPAGFVLRHGVDGTLDGSFAPAAYAGIKVTCVPEDVPCNSAEDAIEVHGLALDPQGRALIAGRSRGSGVVHRVLPVPHPVEDRDLDPDFNGGSAFALNDEFDPPDVSILASSFHDVVVDGLGRAVAVGELLVENCDGSDCTTQRQVIVVRLDADGALDDSFGAGTGVVRLAPIAAVDWESSGAGVALDGSGGIVLTGWSQPDPTTTTSHLLVARLLPDGTGDGAFATDPHLGDGVRLGPSGHLGHDVTAGSSGILVAGTVQTFSPVITALAPVSARNGFVARLTGTAQLDPGFGPAGTGFVFPFGSDGQDSTARGIALDAVGNVLVAGGSLTRGDDGSFEATDVLLARLLPTGVLDATFDEDGRVTTDVGSATGGAPDSAPAQAADVAVAPDGKIVVTGHVTDDRGSRVLVARYDPGVATLECIPDPLDLGGVEVGAGNTAGATCSATGGTVVITDVFVDPASAHAGDFSVDPGSCAAATLLAGQTCDVTVVFTPTAAGARTAVLTAAHTTTAGASVDTVVLQGRGIRIPDPDPTEPDPEPTEPDPEPEPDPTEPGAPGFSATPNPVLFGEQVVGSTSAARTVTATNVGAAVLVISDTALTGAHPDDFAIVADLCSGTILSPGERCTVGVTFSPVTGAGQNRPAQLRFTDTAAGSPHMVALRGSVVVPALELDPDAGPVETQVEATGTGFEPGTAVELRIRGTSVTTVPATDVTPAGFTTTLSIPAGTPGGVQHVLACQRCDGANEVAATALLEVTPRLFVHPTISRPGGVVSARGDGFPANTPVVLRWQAGIGRFVVMADANGEFTRPVLVFRRDVVGRRDLTASISGAEDIVATSPFLAVPGSSQPGDFQIRR